MPQNNVFGDSFGVMENKEVDSEFLNFLGSDPDDVQIAPKKTPPKKKEEGKENPSNKKEGEENGGGGGEEDGSPKVQTRPLLFEDVYGEDEEAENSENSEEANKNTSSTPKEGEANSSVNTPIDNNIFASLSKDLFEQGVFTKEEDEEETTIDTPEAFLDRFELEKKKGAGEVIDKFLTRFGEDYREMFDAVFVNGIAPKSYLERFARIEGIATLDIADVANQEKIVRELYRIEGKSNIDARIKKLSDYGDLEEEAKEAQTLLIAKEEKQKQDEIKAKQDEQDRKSQIRAEYLTNVTRILNDKLKNKDFDGIPISKQFAEQIGDYITRDKYSVKGELITEFDKDLLDLNRPENHELKVKMAMLLKLVKEDPTLSKLVKKAATKETSTLFQGVAQHTSTKTNTSKNKQEDTPTKEKPTPWFSTQK